MFGGKGLFPPRAIQFCLGEKEMPARLHHDHPDYPAPSAAQTSAR
jgi:hypothetical protein